MQSIRKICPHPSSESRPFSKAADESYMAERGIRLNETLTRWRVGTRSRCFGTIHNAPFLSKSEPGQFCSRTCRDVQNETETKGRRMRHFKECLGCGRKFLGKRANNATRSVNCRQKAHRRGSLSPMSQIRQNTPCSLRI